MNGKACSDCKFWEALFEDKESGNCRRYPPVIDALQVSLAKENGYQSHDYADLNYDLWAFPVTRWDLWCGEFSPSNAQSKPPAESGSA